jgi:hypothetical protein
MNGGEGGIDEEIQTALVNELLQSLVPFSLSSTIHLFISSFRELLKKLSKRRSLSILWLN